MILRYMLAVLISLVFLSAAAQADFDVKQGYGATGDGAIDDTAAFQQAITPARQWVAAFTYRPVGIYWAVTSMCQITWRFEGVFIGQRGSLAKAPRQRRYPCRAAYCWSRKARRIRAEHRSLRWATTQGSRG